MAKNQISQIGGKYGPGIENDPGIKKAPQAPKLKPETASGKPGYQPSNGLFESLPANSGHDKRSIGAVNYEPSTGLAEQNKYLR